MDHHEVIDDAIGLEHVAVAVDVALILDVVVGPWEVGLLGRDLVDRVHDHLGDAARIVRMPNVTGATAAQVSAAYQPSECGICSQPRRHR